MWALTKMKNSFTQPDELAVALLVLGEEEKQILEIKH